jgi:hypothetical protein
MPPGRLCLGELDHRTARQKWRQQRRQRTAPGSIEVRKPPDLVHAARRPAGTLEGQGKSELAGELVYRELFASRDRPQRHNCMLANLESAVWLAAMVEQRAHVAPRVHVVTVVDLHRVLVRLVNEDARQDQPLHARRERAAREDATSARDRANFEPRIH